MTTSQAALSETSQVCATEEQISSEVSGESVILHLQSGLYYGLNEVGASIWALIQQPQTLAFIHTQLLEQYEVDSDACWQDLTKIVQELEEIGLVDVKHEPAD